jgi:hypothetical protein
MTILNGLGPVNDARFEQVTLTSMLLEDRSP